MTREQGVEVLRKAQKNLAKASTKEETLAVLQEAGSAVGYKPAFRCLVAGTEPEKSIKWGA
jgi:hypothetical protein